MGTGRRSSSRVTVTTQSIGIDAGRAPSVEDRIPGESRPDSVGPACTGVQTAVPVRCHVRHRFLALPLINMS